MEAAKRPHEKSKEEELMREVIRIAQSARDHGNHPFGCLLADPITGEVLLRAENCVVTSNDPTLHAELCGVSAACKSLDRKVVQDAVLYASTEPCSMCAGAIVWSGISTVIYGTPAEELGSMAGGTFVVPCRHVFSFCKRTINVFGPVLQDEARKVHEGFWK